MRRIFALLILAMSVLACTLSDDLMGTGAAPIPTAIAVDPALMVSRAEDGAFILGNPDAPVTLIVFADWYCPHCQNYKPTIDRVVAEFVTSGQVNYEYRVLPTAGQQNTYILGQWIECAAESGENYFTLSTALYDLLFTGYLTADVVQTQMNERFGLNAEALTACMETASQVDNDMALATEIGVNSTPSVWIRFADGTLQQVQDRSFEGLSALITSAGAEF